MIAINGYQIPETTFPDGTTNVNLKEMRYFPRPGERIDMFWYYENDAELFVIICLAKKFAQNSITLFMPYVPHARMDRVKNTGDVFTLKYFCEVINSLNFTKVVIRDPHSNVTSALLDRCEIESAEDFIRRSVYSLSVYNHIEEKDILMFYPDEGAMKRYSTQSPLPFAFGVKCRDWETGKINSLQVIDNGNSIKGKTVLIVDDICSYGGTFVKAAEKLRELGAEKIYLYVTHCEKNIFNGKLYNDNIGLIDGFFTSEIIGKPDIEVIPSNMLVFN